ncbi:YhgE/Pip family protein [Brachybacterium huguangmaarense]
MRLLKHPRSLLVVLLLPLLVAGVGMWALKDRVDRLADVPAAVVNLDEGTTMTIDGEEQFVPFGRQLAGALTQPGTTTQEGAPATTGFDWRLTDEQDAREGLRDGTYSAVIVIPADFSERMGTLGTPDARQAEIQVTTNDASGALDSAIGVAVSQAAASSTGTEMTRQYLAQLYIGFNSFHDSLSQAADGAEGIDDGVTGLSDGLGQTSDGARQLADGSRGLAGGTRQLADGVRGLDGGIRQTSDGARGLADGIGQLSTGSDGLADGARQLADGLGQLADGADGLADGAAQLSDGINGTDAQPGLVQGVQLLNAGVQGDGTPQNPGLVAGSEQLAQGAQRTADGVKVAFDKGAGGRPGLVDGADQLATGDQELFAGMLQACEAFALAEIAADPRLGALCAEPPSTGGSSQTSILAGLSQAADGSRSFADGIALAAHGDGTAQNPGLVGGTQAIANATRQSADQAPQLAQGIEQLAGGVTGLGQGASQLSDGATQLAGGVRQSADGAAQLSDGATQLAGGVRLTSDGADQLADGTEQLADGSSQLATGADQLASGSDELATGTEGLADGVAQLDDGATQLEDGTGQFAQGLRDGAGQVPTYAESERQSMSEVGAQPVTSVATRQNEADGAATAVFPFVVALALWLGAFGSFLLLPALSRRFLDAAMPMWKVVLRSLLPGIGLGLVQTVAVLAVITAIGVRPVSALGVAVLAFAGAIAFAAFHQALLAVLGNRVGRIASIVVMVLQVVVLAGILPLQTAPPVLQAASSFMPITILSEGLVHAALGGALVSTSSTLLALAAWTGVSIVATMIASRSARSVDRARLVTEADALPA